MYLRSVKYGGFFSMWDLVCVWPSLCASCLKFHRNWRKRTHPELIDFPQTCAQLWGFMNRPRTSAASVCQWNVYFFLSFLWIWIWLSTNHWERVLFMLCQKLQHASCSPLVILTLFVILLCILRRKPLCVLFVMGAKGWGGDVFSITTC